MPAPVVRHRPVAVGSDEVELVIPGIRVQGPAVAEHDRLPGPPVLVIDAHAGRRGEVAHLCLLPGGGPPRWAVGPTLGSRGPLRVAAGAHFWSLGARHSTFCPLPGLPSGLGTADQLDSERGEQDNRLAAPVDRCGVIAAARPVGGRYAGATGHPGDASWRSPACGCRCNEDDDGAMCRPLRPRGRYG